MPKPYFQSERVTLYHGDARDILPSLPALSVDMTLTDPPYLVAYRGRWGSKQGVIAGDTSDEWLVPVFKEIFRVLREHTLCLSFYGWPHADVFLARWRALGFRPISHLAFVKRRWGLGYFTRAQHEGAYLLAKGRPHRPGKAISDVVPWDHEPTRCHPNQKPVSAITRILQTYTAQGECILDPFVGSGTTLVAAQQAGRHAIGIEVAERYCEIAAQRITQTKGTT